MAQTVKIGRVKGNMWYTNLTDINPLEGDMWFDKNTSSIYQYKNNEWVKIDKLPTKVSELINDADYVDSERLTDVVDSLETQIKYGGRKYHYSINLTTANTIKELVDELKTY